MSERITRRGMMGLTAKVGSTIGAALLIGTAAAIPAHADASQLRKQDVRYQDQPKGDQRCSGCANFQAPSACKVVSGSVNPNGWCLLYAAKKA